MFDFEYIKGILFIRFNDDLTVYNYKILNKILMNIIINAGIRHIVYNLFSVSIVDNYGKQLIRNSVDLINNYNGNVSLCNSKFNFNNEFSIYENELLALKLLEL